jgi:nitrilase
MSKVAAIQMIATMDLETNLAMADQLIRQAVKKGAQLLVLPEDFALMGKHNQDRVTIAENVGEGRIQNFLSKQARQFGIWLVAGTVPLRTEIPGKIRSACLVFDDQGEQRGRYDKIHLFDVEVADQKRYYQESSVVEPGSEIVVLPTPFGKLGLAICYDLRFPELFRALAARGAEIFTLPAAFTYVTGQAHWEVLLRARAIENLCYVIAAGQGGIHQNKRETYGHSMIIDPWGKICQQLKVGSDVVVAEIDLAYQKDLRMRFPVLAHRRLIEDN